MPRRARTGCGVVRRPRDAAVPEGPTIIGTLPFLKQPPTFAAALWIALAICPRAFALEPSLDVSQYGHTAWTVRDGSLRAEVTSIAQTSDGYLWLGTEFGLLRFDGLRAVPWRPPPSGRLPDERVRALLAARDGTLWIGTQSGLAHWDGKELVANVHLAAKMIDALTEGRDGTVWVGTGLNPGWLCAIRRDTTACVGEDGRFGIGVSPFEDSRGRLWVGAGTGVWRWTPDPTVVDRRPGGASAWTEGADGLYLARNGTITRMAGDTVEPLRLHRAPAEARLRRLLTDRHGAMWIGTPEHGLLHRHPDGREDVFTQGDGLSGNAVIGLFEDRETNVWVITDAGLDRFRPLSASTYSDPQGIGGNIASVLVDRDQTVWISASRGLYALRNGRRYSYRARSQLVQSPDVDEIVVTGFPESPAGSLFQDRRGRLWLGARAGFGYVENARFVRFNRVPEGFVDAITDDREGNLWVSHRDAGLLRITADGTVERFPWAPMVPDPAPTFWRAAADPVHGGVWLGSFEGDVAQFSSGSVRALYSGADRLGRGVVHDVRVSADGTLWVATDGGLTRVHDRHVATLNTSSGLPCSTVDSTVEDADGGLWLFTACGLAHVTRAELDAWTDAVDRGDAARTIRPAILDASDGVPRPAVSASTPHIAITRDGRVWLATRQGASVVDPRNLAVNTLVPPVHIEQVTADRKTYGATAGLRISPHVRDLQIDYTALSLVAPEENRFRVKLEGRDRDWQDVGTRRQAFYTDLGPGSYRFRVMGSNNSGVWNETGATLDFSIAPAYYQTRWFAAFVVFATATLLWVAYRLRVAQLARQFNRTLDARVSERTRIARDLHDTLLQSFQGVLLRFQSVEKVLPPDAAEARRRLDRALDQAEAAVTEGRNAIQGLRASATTANDLANGIAAFATALASDPSVVNAPAFTVDVEGESRDLNPLVRDEAYGIATEALQNTLKHAEARHVTVTLHYEPRQFRLMIHDDGKGIDAETLQRQQRAGHFGLPGMRERATIVKGQLEVRSAPGAGTEIELRVPAMIAYGRAATSWWARL